MTTPYNTGRIKIGLRYRSPLPALSDDAEQIQRALLSTRTPCGPVTIPLDTSWWARLVRWVRGVVGRE